MRTLFQFKLRRRVFRYRGKFRWIVTDGTQAHGTVMAYGIGKSTREARKQAGIKMIEISRSHERPL